MNKSIQPSRLKKHFAEYLAKVEQGKEVIVCKRNVPVVRMTRIEPLRKNTSKPGWAAKTVQIRADITLPCIPPLDVCVTF